MPSSAPSPPYVRRMTQGDLDQVAAIEQQSFSDPWSFESFYKELVQPHCTSPLVLVGASSEADRPEPIAGYMILWCLLDELHIANVAIHADWRGRGWGEKLIQLAFYLGQQWEIPHCLLEVRRSNSVARQLYEKLGFRLLSVRKSYYRSPVEDALVLHHPQPPRVSAPPLPVHDDALRRPGE